MSTRALRLALIQRRKIWEMKKFKIILMKKIFINQTYLAKRKILMDRGEIFA